MHTGEHNCFSSIVLNANIKEKNLSTPYELPETLYISPSYSTTSSPRKAFPNETATSLRLGSVHNTEAGNVCKNIGEITGPEEHVLSVLCADSFIATCGW